MPPTHEEVRTAIAENFEDARVAYVGHTEGPNGRTVRLYRGTSGLPGGTVCTSIRVPGEWRFDTGFVIRFSRYDQ